jgi:hypothetical protein
MEFQRYALQDSHTRNRRDENDKRVGMRMTRERHNKRNLCEEEIEKAESFIYVLSVVF